MKIVRQCMVTEPTGDGNNARASRTPSKGSVLKTYSYYCVRQAFFIYKKDSRLTDYISNNHCRKSGIDDL